MRVHFEARLRQLRRKVELAPDALLAAGEDGFGKRSVTAKLISEAGDAGQIAAQPLITVVPASLLQRLAGVADQVFDQDLLFAMRPVACDRWLIEKADCVSRFRFDLR